VTRLSLIAAAVMTVALAVRLSSATAQKWAWHLKAAENGFIVATDRSQGYDNEDDARHTAGRVIAGESRAAQEKLRRNETAARSAR